MVETKKKVTDIAAQEAKYFTVIVAAKGYHQCPLASESQELTTFVTPYRRFKYLWAPYGLSSIAEHYNRRMAEALEGLTGYHRIVDLIQNSQAVKKCAALKKAMVKKDVKSKVAAKKWL